MKGLVLEGGGVKGSYQVGAFYAFCDCKIKFDGIVGTSIGSFNAAMLASGRERELLKFWYDLDPGLAMNFDQRIIDLYNDDEKKVDIGALIGAFSTLKSIIKNSGVDYSNLLSIVGTALDYNKLVDSPVDYGLATIQISKSNGIKPMYVKKEDILDSDDLVEYIMASCYLPIFKHTRIVNNHYYLDGGFYDNAPFKILTDKGYKDIFIVNIRGIGLRRNFPVGVNVTYITPSRNNGKVLELNKRIIKDNIKMGYYDTIRVLKRLDGYKYCFKRRKERYYKFLCRKIDNYLLKRVMNFFGVYTYKEVVIKSLEYVLEKDGVDYYNIYSAYKLIKKYRHTKSKKFIYRFIRKISFF